MILTERKRKITGVATAANVLHAILAAESDIDQNKEHFWVLGLNIKNVIQYVELVSLGTLNTCPVHPREVYRFAITKGVAAVIVGHNHPSGVLDPSKEDAKIQRRLSESGELLGIKLLDFIILSPRGDYWSYADHAQGRAVHEQHL